MAFVIRKAECEKDYDIISKNAHIIWNEHYGNILKKEQIDYMLSKFQSSLAIKEQIKKDKYEYYILEDDEVVGYIGIKIQPEDKKLFLSKLYILSNFRRKGYSRKVFTFLKEYASSHNLSGIYLTVNKENLLSIEVYRHFGFITVREKKTDIGGGFYMDDYIMEYEMPLTRIALISIIVEDKSSVDKLNSILSDYGQYIIGRMGIPYEKKNVSVISVAVDAPNDIINTLSGKLGALNGINTKTVYSNK